MADCRYPRTEEEVCLDIEYSRRLHELHCKLFRRLRWLAVLVSLAAGASAVTDLVRMVPGGVLLAAGIVTFMTIVDAISHWEERAAQHNLWRRQFARLAAQAEGMSYEDLQRAYKTLDAEVDDVLRILETIAYNDVERANELTHMVRPESITQRALRLLL